MPSGKTHLHLLTPVTRKENIREISRSIDQAARLVRGQSLEIHWHHVVGETDDPGGQRSKNRMLDRIDNPEAWVLVLDDDTLMHRRLLHWFMRSKDEAPAVIVSQERADGEILHAAPGNVRPGMIDIGQAILRRDLIGKRRIPERYDGDGEFLVRVLDSGKVGVYVDRVLSYHNRLEVSA